MLRNLLLFSLLAFGLVSGEFSASAQPTDSPAKPAGAATSTTAPPVQIRPPKLYRLSPNDVVMLKVYQEDDLQAQVRINRDGTVTLPLIGQVTIGGKTIDEAAGAITAMFDDGYLVNPQVSLTIAEYGKRRFTVLGQVQRPGTYEMPSEDAVNLLQAISMAGGYTRLGAPWKITLQRTTEGEQKIFKLDADAMSKDKNAKPFDIQPDDTITVGEKLI
jgi:polysaccharide export outer membrane protein